MSIFCRKMCDCPATALGGSLIVALAVRLAGELPISLGMAAQSGISVFFITIMTAEIAKDVFETSGYEESTSRSIAEWTVATLYALSATGIYLKSVGAVASIVAGFFCSLGSGIIFLGGMVGGFYVGYGIAQLLDPNYESRDWDRICFEWPISYCKGLERE